MSAFRFFGRPEPVVREIPPNSATGQARPARRAEDLLAPPGEARPGWAHPSDDRGWAQHTYGWASPPTGRATAAEGWGGGPEVADRGWAGPREPQTRAMPSLPGPTAPGDPNPSWRTFPPPPIPAAPQRWASADGGVDPTWSGAPRSAPGRGGSPHPAEAAALGAAFAADYLSWDEDDPDLRSRVLGEYLAVRRPVQLGWSGQGRQRADFALPGLVRPDGDGRVLVDVRVRVTPYVRVPGGRVGPPDPPPDDGPASPSAAPAPAARGWRGLPGRWIRIAVAVLVAGDRLVIDAEEEAEDPWPTPDPELADDLPEESP
ncbi:hypothetical protein [Pseudonocardia xishanensis]|uniref:Uncharacterized protein n=1 Tax=Pseudonocardia xishanensis TaxID=630995 RepID=A0ABP8RE16_9PSEU